MPWAPSQRPKQYHIEFATREEPITLPSRNLEPMPPGMNRRLHLSLLIGGISAFFISGCDSVIRVAGADFPVWILCLVVGILMSLSLRPVFVATGIDEWMTPRPLVYASLALTIAFVCWLLVWR